MLLIFLPMKTSVATRRSFLKSSLAGVFAAGVAPQFIPARLLGANAPSNKITLGCIGLGAHGIGVNLKSFLQQDDCRIVAVCDVWGRRREEARKLVEEKYGGPGCAMIRDFRALLARPDIDVAVISTPDHWHVTMAQLALAAGKKVFCEKPTLTIEEGRRLANDVAVRKAMFAVGLEDRAVIYYHKLAEAVRNGAIGKLERIKVSLMLKPVFARDAGNRADFVRRVDRSGLGRLRDTDGSRLNVMDEADSGITDGRFQTRRRHLATGPAITFLGARGLSAGAVCKRRIWLGCGTCHA